MNSGLRKETNLQLNSSQYLILSCMELVCGLDGCVAGRGHPELRVGMCDALNSELELTSNSLFISYDVILCNPVGI